MGEWAVRVKWMCGRCCVDGSVRQVGGTGRWVSGRI